MWLCQTEPKPSVTTTATSLGGAAAPRHPPGTPHGRGMWPWDGTAGPLSPVPCTAHTWGARPPPQGACWKDWGPPPPPSLWPPGIVPCATRGTTPPVQRSPQRRLHQHQSRIRPSGLQPHQGLAGDGGPAALDLTLRAAGHKTAELQPGTEGFLIDPPAEQPLHEQEHQKPRSGAGCLSAPRGTEPRTNHPCSRLQQPKLQILVPAEDIPGTPIQAHAAPSLLPTSPAASIPKPAGTQSTAPACTEPRAAGQQGRKDARTPF